MWRTVWGRVLIACVTAVLVGVELVGNITGITRVLEENVLHWCDGTNTFGCRWQYSSRLFQTQIATLIYMTLLLAVFPMVARWCVAPVWDLVPIVTQIGPQNLGHRIRPPGGRGDALVALSRALDDMMDRIAAGYEGQRRFAANASHELRTPLAVQRTLIEVGMGRTLTTDQLTLLTRQLLQANERNERLIEGLLVLSEADQGLVARLPQRLDQIAGSVLAAHRAWADEIGVTIVADLQRRVVQGEDVLLERLVTNLVQNALKYNRPGGTIHVTVGRSPALGVINTGQIVPPSAVDGLFEPFKRLVSDRIDHSGGAGLGLAIARSITQAHEGRISAEPADGGGLHVQVHLPLDDDGRRPGRPTATPR